LAPRRHRRLSIKLAVLATVVVLAVAMLWYVVPRMILSRPVFLPEAAETAFAILKEEVGLQAVENGIFEVPHRKVRVPFNGQALVCYRDENERWDFCLLVRGGKGQLLLWRSRSISPLSWNYLPPATAAMGREETRKLWLALALLISVQARDGEQVQEVNVAHLLHDMAVLADRTWPGNRLVRNEYGLTWFATLEQLVRGACLFRLVKETCEREGLSWQTDDAAVGAARLESLRASFPPESWAQSVWLQSTVGELELTPDEGALRFLRRVERFRLARETRGWLERIPILGRMFARPPLLDRFIVPEVADNIAYIEQYGGGTREELVAKAEASAFDSSLDKADRQIARRYLCRMSHERFVGAFARNFASLPLVEKATATTFYASDFGEDQTVALTAIDDDAPIIAAAACYQLYRITKDGAYLRKLMESAYPQPESGKPACGNAVRFLRYILWEHPDRQDLVAFVRDHFRYETWIEAVYSLGEAGGAENASFLASLAFQPGGIVPDGTPREDCLHMRCTAARQLASTREPLAEEAFMRYLESAPMPGEEALRDVVIVSLAHCGGKRGLELLKQLRDRERANPSMSRTAEGDGWLLPEDESIVLYQEPRQPLELLEGAILELEARTADSPAEFLANLGSEEIADLEGQLHSILAERYGTDELQVLLADNRLTSIRIYVYLALRKKRASLSEEGSPP
jgi:hypothetical protein